MYFSVMSKTLYDHLTELPDHRRLQGRRFSLSSFFEMVILAGLSGQFSINAISRFIKNNEDFFIDRYGLNHGVPKKTVIFNILTQYNYTHLNQLLCSWMTQFVDSSNTTWISIDGKALASTVTDKQGSKQNFQLIVNSFAAELEVVVATAPFENRKSNEIKSAQELIKQLELKGVIFTLDALHCQKKQLRSSWIQEMTMLYN